ncbi:MAG: molybdopterin molybdotransferase [Paracoccaceae bacterium]
MISVEEATAQVLALTNPMGHELIDLQRANGRSMVLPATASLSQPPFDASSMDGYALGSDAIVGTRFKLLAGEASAGHRFEAPLLDGQAVRIFTGAPIPKGTARIVLQEHVSQDTGEIIIGPDLEGGPYIRTTGQDFMQGQTLSPRRLKPNDLALLAAMNVAQVTVARRPLVAIIATGDELVMPGDVPNQDQIIASNIFALKAMAEDVGATAQILPIARDSVSELRAVLSLALEADVIVTIGGASVGDHDLVKSVTQEMGLARAFYKIAMRPGKPLMAGRLQGRAMLGLPGNPVSAIVCGHLFMVPLLRAMQGDSTPTPRPKLALLTHDLPANGARTHYMRSSVSRVKGTAQITVASNQDSALLSVLIDANALLIMPQNSDALSKWSPVSYLDL